VGLFGGSFKVLSPHEAGLVKNTITGSISTSPIYTAGRYFLGLGKDFVIYPATLQTLEYGDQGDSPALNTGALDGQGRVFLEVSLQYRLMLGSLGDLYSNYQTNYKAKLLTTAESTIKNVASSRFAVQDYFEIRQQISDVLHAACNLKFQEDFAFVELFQLRNINPPDQTETYIVLTLVTQEQQNQADQVKLSDLRRADVSNLVQTTQVTIDKFINAQAQADASILISNAQARSNEIALAAYGEAYSYMRTQLNFTSQDLLTHIFYETMRSLQDPSQMVVGVGNALLQY